MEILDSFDDSKREKLFSLRHLALFIATPSALANLYIFYITLDFGINIYSFITIESVLGVVLVIATYVLVFLRKQLWFYLFLVTLFLRTFGFIVLYDSFWLNIKFNHFTFSILGCLLLILHVGLNTDYVQPKQKDESTESKISKDKIQFFENQFSRKTKEQLDAVNTKDLVEEAKIALKNVLESQ